MTPAQNAVARLATVFGEPRTTDPARFFDEYAKALTGYDARVLDSAIDRAIREATFWPKPAEIIALAKDASAALYAATRPAEHRPIEVRPEPSPEAKARLNALMSEFKQGVAERAIGEAPKQDREPNWKAGQRDEFRTMQAHSRSGLQRKHSALSAVSRRMTGEHEE